MELIDIMSSTINLWIGWCRLDYKNIFGAPTSLGRLWDHIQVYSTDECTDARVKPLCGVVLHVCWLTMFAAWPTIQAPAIGRLVVSLRQTELCHLPDQTVGVLPLFITTHRRGDGHWQIYSIWSPRGYSGECIIKRYSHMCQEWRKIGCGHLEDRQAIG